MKQGHKRKSWLKRYFILKDGYLTYRVALGKPAKGRVNIVMAHVTLHPMHPDHGRENVITVQPALKSDKDLTLQAETPETAAAWLHALKSASRNGLHVRGGFV